MGSYTASAVAAIVGGVIVAVVIFVPDVAYRYRRSGRLRGSDVVAVVVVPTYALALWTYTLLPLPDPDDIVCRDPNLDAFRFVDQIRASGVDSLADLLTNWAFATTVLNVLLFVPLGVTLIYFPIAHMVWYWAGPDAITDAAKALTAVRLNGVMPFRKWPRKYPVCTGTVRPSRPG